MEWAERHLDCIGTQCNAHKHTETIAKKPLLRSESLEEDYTFVPLVDKEMCLRVDGEFGSKQPA